MENELYHIVDGVVIGHARYMRLHADDELVDDKCPQCGGTWWPECPNCGWTEHYDREDDDAYKKAVSCLMTI